MKNTLTLQEVGWGGDGPPVVQYRVCGMPPDEIASVANFGSPNRNDWRICRFKADTKSHWIGHYETAEVALAVLQKDLERPTAALNVT